MPHIYTSSDARWVIIQDRGDNRSIPPGSLRNLPDEHVHISHVEYTTHKCTQYTMAHGLVEPGVKNID